MEIDETRTNKRVDRSRVCWCLALIILGLQLITNSVTAADRDRPSDPSPWLKAHVLNTDGLLPFSFVYGGKSSGDVLKAWPKKTEVRQLDPVRTEHITIWADPSSALQVRLEVIEFANSSVVEWTAHFKNDGKIDAPILENVQALDISLPVAGKGIPSILYSKGAAGMDCYSLQKKPLDQLGSFQLTNEAGSKNVEDIPFFDVRMAGRGLIGALGWPGKWAITFTRPTEAAIAVSAGMDSTHLSLHPGEEIRTPEVLLLPWVGDDVDAHNALRRHILKYHTPYYDGKPVVLPLDHGGWGGMKTSTCLRLIEQITKENIGFENFWMDAGWNGPDRPVAEFQVLGEEDWFVHVGDWRINQNPRPDGKGLRPISDAAHAKGMKFLLWFDPERAIVGTPLTIQHPDWFIGVVDPSVNFRMFDFGNPVARQFMIDEISEIITKEGIDIYRQDCNYVTTPFWEQADRPERKGVTQIRYAEGLLAFWDELRRRHPHLIIDIVQRNDLETISRGVDLTRADYPVLPEADPIGAQISTEGLASWMPLFGTVLQLHPNNDYHFRSGMAPGVGFALFNTAGTKDQVGTFIRPDFPFDWIRTMVAQYKRIRPFYSSDYYPLLPYSANPNYDADPRSENSAGFEWAAWQFNRAEQGDGMVQAFRREKNDEPTKNLPLRGLDPAAMYEVTDFDAKMPITISGRDLMQQGLHVEIKGKPGAAIIVYKKVR